MDALEKAVFQRFGEEGAKMTPEEFVNVVVDAYAMSREPTLPHPKLCRGESRSVASATEDLLAFFLVKHIPAIERIYINQPLRIRGQSLLKPDLVICDRSRICAFIDVKMDLGYKRDSFDTTMRQKDSQITELRGQVFTFRDKNEGKRGQIELPLSQNAKYIFVIVSRRNVSPSLFSVFEECASSLRNTALHVLTSDCHPNDRYSKDELTRRLTICHEAFQNMEHEIQRVIDGNE